MELTDAQLEDIKVNYLEQKKLIRDWMTDNNLTQAEVRPQQILGQLRAKYTPEVIQPLMQAIQQDRFGSQITMMVGRMISRPQTTVEQCDKLLTKLADAVVTVEAKKAEIQAG